MVNFFFFRSGSDVCVQMRKLSRAGVHRPIDTFLHCKNERQSNDRFRDGDMDTIDFQQLERFAIGGIVRLPFTVPWHVGRGPVVADFVGI